jgi:hypothetical protein
MTPLSTRTSEASRAAQARREQRQLDRKNAALRRIAELAQADVTKALSPEEVEELAALARRFGIPVEALDMLREHVVSLSIH